jgi:cyclophilin family peptidyl-prolyl cis-trans isomerase
MNKNLLLILGLIVISIGFFLWTNQNNNKNNQINMTEENNQNTLEQNNGETILAKLNTNLGLVELELYPEEAPKTVDNFVKLSKDGFYDGTKFHRVIKDFMIQGGDPLSKDESQRQFWGTGGPGYTFEDEINNVDLVEGVIAMANAGPNTNGSQFFIITAPATPWLQGKHTGFGKVVSGMDIVKKIEDTETGPSDQPTEDIEITSVEIN